MLVESLLFAAFVWFATGEVVYYPVKYENLGCWSVEFNSTISDEGNSLLGEYNYSKRELAISKCARVAAQQGKAVFVIQDGGKCSTFCNGYLKYLMRNGSSSCPANGKGNDNVANVYKLIKLAEVELENLGCWFDTWDRAIPLLEGQPPLLLDHYWNRREPIAKCAQVAYERDFNVFSVQNGGECASSMTAGNTYSKYGGHDTCRMDGEGGPWGNQVYRIHRISESYFPDV